MAMAIAHKIKGEMAMTSKETLEKGCGEDYSRLGREEGTQHKEVKV